MENPLSKLALDYWYKVVMVVSIFVFLLVGAGLLPEFPTAPTSFISIGGFFVGLGEWVNHPLQSIVLQRDALTYEKLGVCHARKNKILGIVFVILGVFLVFTGVYKML